ncbi:probable protein phosphatase 2C 58, partial [Phoenix dactylifera]|uniref:protein-serine/threonine phosphatase n=1 Tax=Phoenix dactylifera TaxID=42345 RepID=A0A8B9ARA4_PHODC
HDSSVCDTGKGKSKSSIRKVTYGFHLVEGKQGHAMEDYHAAEFKQVDGYEVGLFAIFDGHSGQDVASYLRNHLFDNILHEPDFWTDTMSAIRRTYHRTDRKILKRKANDVRRRGGSTAVTVILINGEKLVVANIGDSRAVICEEGVARQLSVDHEPLKERHVIESKGGFVTNEIGNVPRVDGQLAMSRSFGDRTLKEHISSDPDVVIEDIDEDAEFIILASDGLWKVMSNQEAVDTIKDIKDAQRAAMELIEEALPRKSKDDISCIVVRLH